MDYWKANSQAKIAEDGRIKTVDNIDEILKKVSKSRGADVTTEEVESLEPSEQLDFAIFAYNQFEEVMGYYRIEDEDIAIIIAMEGQRRP